MPAGRLPPFVPSRPRPILVDGVPLRIEVPDFNRLMAEARPSRPEPVRHAPGESARPPHPFRAPRPKVARAAG